MKPPQQTTTDMNQAALNQIIDMGFPQWMAEEALKKNNNNLERATEYLITNQENMIEEIPPLVDANTELIEYNPNQNFKTISENQLEQALKESLQDQKMTDNSPLNTSEDDLNKAIEASLKETTVPKSTTTSSSDHDLNLAIEASLKDTPTIISSFNDTTEKREKNFPIGLQNVGNTCYVNSLLQTYFALPPFVDEIFKFPSDHYPDDFVTELQKLFSFMCFSQKKFINPQQVVKKIMKNGISIGKQQDVGEFHDLFLQEVEKSFRLIQQDPTKLFYGKTKDSFRFNNETGKIMNKQSTSEFSNLILNVSEELNDLYSSLDAYTSIETLEYTTDLKFKTTATKSTWFESTPTVFVIQLQRISFNKENKTTEKINLPFSFYKKIHVDRYLECNKDKTLLIREKTKILKKQIETLQLELNGLLNFNQQGISTPDLLSQTISFLSSYDKSEKSDLAIKLMNELQNEVQSKINVLKEKISELQTTAESLYDFSNKFHEYQLHSVLVHEGNVNSGHYYSFLFQNDHWFKCNDTQIIQVSEEEVWKVSEGGSNSSAYCLIYYDTSKVNISKMDQYWTHIPSNLRNIINDDNLKFLRLLEEKNSKIKYKFQNRTIQLAKKINETFEKYKQEVIDGNIYDKRLLDNVSYLMSLKEYSYAKYEIAVIQYNFSEGENLFSLKEINPMKWESFLLLIDLNPNDFEHQNEMIKKFVDVGQQFFLIAGITAKGISLLFSQKYFEGIQQLHHALIKDESMNSLLSRRKTISKFIAVGCDLLYKKVESNIFLQLSDDLIQKLKLIQNMISVSFDIENCEIYDEIKKRFLGLYTTIETILSEEQKKIMMEIEIKYY
eukprot:gene10741-3361_t